MKTGLQRLLENPRKWLDGSRVGLVANPTTVDSSLRHAVSLLWEHPDVDLRLLFGPEHGIYGAAQDMKGVDGGNDRQTSLPVISLYGHDEESLAPRPEHLEKIDVLLFDIQDIGSRYYTYAATMALCMKAVARAGKRAIVLDRPNPIDGIHVEGGGIGPGLESFVGLYPVPQRHGMTVGELARLYNQNFDIGCDLEVIACEGWERDQLFDETDLPWVMPSPNMPALETALVYPGMCLLEGTNISEARGTTRPFELFGAPFVDGFRLTEELASMQLPGVVARPCVFEPTFHKFAGQSCGGVQLHVTDRDAFLPLRTGVAVLVAMRKLYPRDFAWRERAYEFRDDVPAIDLLLGYAAAREAIDAGRSLDAVMSEVEWGADVYWQGRASALLYGP